MRYRLDRIDRLGGSYTITLIVKSEKINVRCSRLTFHISRMYATNLNITQLSIPVYQSAFTYRLLKTNKLVLACCMHISPYTVNHRSQVSPFHTTIRVQFFNDP